MPNWCNNNLTIQGPQASVIRIRDELRVSDKDPLSFNNHVPLEGDALDYLTAWGTRDVIGSYAALEDHSDQEVDAYLSYSFDTAWSPPRPWLAALTAMFPELSFMMSYEEPGSDFYGISSGSEGLFSDMQLNRHEHLLEESETYQQMVKDIAGFTQEEIIKFFSGIVSFDGCCEGTEKWDEALSDKPNWDKVEMDEFQPLAALIIERIEYHNLPLFINVDWGYKYNQMFKDRLSEGVPNG